MLDIHYNCDNHFMCISQIIMLYTLNLYSAKCKLHFNKTGRKKYITSLLLSRINSELNIQKMEFSTECSFLLC